MSSQTSAVTAPKRAYRSPRRQQQAIATRLAILDAARSLFERHGFPATTIEAIAEEAEVSAKTVYLAFVNKTALLRALWDRALEGDSDATPVGERDWYLAVLDEPDQLRQVGLVASHSCAMKQRLTPLLRVPELDHRDAHLPAAGELQGMSGWRR